MRERSMDELRMNWYCLDMTLVPLGFLMCVSYHLWLWQKVKTQPHQTYVGLQFNLQRSWVLTIVKIITSSHDKSGRLEYEATACLAVMLYRVTLGLKTNISTKGQKPVDNALLQILDHACNSSQFLELLFQCLLGCGSATQTEPSNLIPSACESCKVIWYLVYAMELMSLNDGQILFPLASWRRPDQDPLTDFVSIAILQLVSRICLSDTPECALIFLQPYLPLNSDELELGGDGTIISDLFSVLASCDSYIKKESKDGGPTRPQSKLSNPRSLAVHCCSALATISSCLHSTSEKKHSAAVILTSSQEKQRSRLSVLVHLSSSDDTVTGSLQPHCAAAMMALSSILSLENELNTESSIYEAALTLFPPMGTLRTPEDFYEFIENAGLLDYLKEFLSSEDQEVRAKSCSAIGYMCRHNSFFYEPLAKNGIVDLMIDRCADPDKCTLKFACFAVGNAAYHNDRLYEILQRSIPQQMKLLLASEESKTKANAAGARSNLLRNSNRLCEPVVSSGAIQALLKIVNSYATLALSPTRKDMINESPLKILLIVLPKMCDHSLCRRCIGSSDLFMSSLSSLKQSPDLVISEYATVIIARVGQD